MRNLTRRRLAALLLICFGAGICLSFLLPVYFLVFTEAVLIVTAGILLFSNHY